MSITDEFRDIYLVNISWITICFALTSRACSQWRCRCGSRTAWLESGLPVRREDIQPLQSLFDVFHSRCSAGVTFIRMLLRGYSILCEDYSLVVDLTLETPSFHNPLPGAASKVILRGCAALLHWPRHCVCVRVRMLVDLTASYTVCRWPKKLSHSDCLQRFMLLAAMRNCRSRKGPHWESMGNAGFLPHH